jgi:hypothetical protein
MRQIQDLWPPAGSKFRQFPRAGPSFLLALGAVLFSACVPVVARFPHFDLPDVVYLTREDVGSASLPLMAYYPYHGIYISIYLRQLYFGVHVPQGTVVQIDDQTIQLEGTLDAGPYSKTFAVQAAPHTDVWGMAPQFISLPDPYTSSNYLGPLAGAGHGRGSAWYLFMGFRPGEPNHDIRIPTAMSSGTIVLPSMTINGVHYAAQRLPFTQERVFRISAVN